MIDHLIIKVFFSILRSNEGSVMCKGLFNLKKHFCYINTKKFKNGIKTRGVVRGGRQGNVPGVILRI